MSAINMNFGYMRLKQVLAVYPVGKTLWWKMVKEKRAPQPVKLSEGVTAWRIEDIKRLCELRKSGQDWTTEQEAETCAESIK